MSAFPLELLPPLVQDAIGAQVAMANYPVEGVGTAALAVLAHATQGLYNVDALHTAGVTYPLSQLYMVLARSGDAKSSVFGRLMEGVRRWQSNQRVVFEHDQHEFEADRKIWDKAKQKAEKDGDRNTLIALAQSEPKQPRSPENILSKTTTNGVFRTLQTGWPSIGIFTGEGGSLLGGHSLRKENSPVEFASLMTQIWDGDNVDRTTGEVTVWLRGRRLSGLIMVQQEVAESFLTDPLLKVHGLHARFLIVNPPPWQPREADFLDPQRVARDQRLSGKMEAFHEAVVLCLSSPLRVTPQDMRELDLPTLWWDDEATKHMQAWNNSTALPCRGENGETFFNRTFEHACRIAGSLAVFVGATIIKIEHARAATALVDFYADQLRNLDLGSGESRDTSDAPVIAKLDAWMRKQERGLSFRDLARNGPNVFRKLNLDARERILRAMERDEYIRADEIVSGVNRTTVWTSR